MRRTAVFVAFAAAVSFSANTTTSAQSSSSGVVYVMTNRPDAPGNSIEQFARAADGSLTHVTEVSTGGLGGTGNGAGALDPLGSEDSLVSTAGGSMLLAVNAGSNQISALSAQSSGLQLLNTTSSGGSFPNSVAVHGDLVYVVNAHGTPNITAFRLGASGLTSIAGSTRSLPGGASSAPHDIHFSPDGVRLLVTEGGSNTIDIFELGTDGLVTGVTTQAAAGATPFGMKFGRGGVLLVTEADSGSVSSYSLAANNTLSVISAAVPDGQMATCWLSLTGDGKFAFVSNTGSGNLSTYQVSGNGSLNLEQAVAATADGGAPIDSSFSNDAAFLYAVDSAMGRIIVYQRHGASLTPLGAVTGLPATVQGIAAQ
jgi:6-phosphogluconolactonase